MTTCTDNKNQTCCNADNVNESKSVRFAPRVDIAETEHELLLIADLPGVRPEDLDIQIEDGELCIHGKCQPRKTGGSQWLQEYQIGDFERSFQVGELVDATKISANLKHGVLTVHLPKAEATKPRRIEIKS